MKKMFFLIVFFTFCKANADSIASYINISKQIPQMELKADAQSQTWAHSARTIITLTCDSILDSLTLANQEAKKQGVCLFDLPRGEVLNAEKLDEMIQDIHAHTNMQNEKLDQWSVSKVALLALQKHYPCEEKKKSKNEQEHIE